MTPQRTPPTHLIDGEESTRPEGPDPRPEPTSRFLRACRRLPVDRIPVWLMRQAGRYMSEYRALRARYSLLEICAEPELAAEVTLQPVQALGVDAAILFADILLPLIPMGADLAFVKGEGPIIYNPVRSAGDVLRLRRIDPEIELPSVPETIRLLRKELPPEVPLIGFAGGPFTVASYLVEGGPTRHFRTVKGLMYEQPWTWHRLMQLLRDIILDYLTEQARAGAQALQIFDSWVGALSPEDYQEYVQPHTAYLMRGLRKTGVPVIHFGTGTATLLDLMVEAGGDVLGLDWRVPLDQARRRFGSRVALQGNLDPIALFAPREELERQVMRVLHQAGPEPGYIFNLGHGILPETPVDNVRAVVEMVHTYRPQDEQEAGDE